MSKLKPQVGSTAEVPTFALVVSQFDPGGRLFILIVTSTFDKRHALARLTLNGWDPYDLTASTDPGLTQVWRDGRLHLNGQWQSDRVEESELDLATTIQRAREWVCHFSNYMESGSFAPISAWANPRN